MKNTVEKMVSGWRYGNELFWVKGEDGHWQWWQRSDLKQRLRVDAGVTSAEAKRILDEIAATSVIEDRLLTEEIAWHKWLRGQNRACVGDDVIFTDPKSGLEMRQMTVKEHNRYIHNHFPSKPFAPTGGGMGQLLG